MNDIQTADNPESQNIIRELRDRAFESSDEQVALALGRPADEVKRMIEGAEVPDEDVVIKARGIAGQRGVELDEPPIQD